jgi:hypothetical protein
MSVLAALAKVNIAPNNRAIVKAFYGDAHIRGSVAEGYFICSDEFNPYTHLAKGKTPKEAWRHARRRTDRDLDMWGVAHNRNYFRTGAL